MDELCPSLSCYCTHSRKNGIYLLVWNSGRRQIIKFLKKLPYPFNFYQLNPSHFDMCWCYLAGSWYMIRFSIKMLKWCCAIRKMVLCISDAVLVQNIQDMLVKHNNSILRSSVLLINDHVVSVLNFSCTMLQLLLLFYLFFPPVFSVYCKIHQSLVKTILNINQPLKQLSRKMFTLLYEYWLIC